MVFKDLVGGVGVYPKTSVEMILLQNHVILTSLKHFAKSIREKFFEDFDYLLWNNFFHCAIAFMTQPQLQLESFSLNKRQRIMSRYRDMRRETAKEVRSMWYSLGVHKIKFVPGMVGPFLEMTLIPESDLRKDTIPIFFDMMQCEFFDNVPASRNNHQIPPFKLNFKEFEEEMITQLDSLIEGGRGDENFRDLFDDILKNLCDNHQDLRDQGLRFVRIVVRLLKRLLEYRKVSKASEENRDIRMICILSLLEFYNEISRQDLYVRYLHKLVDIHLDCENYTEAAFVLLLHAKLLRWTDEPLKTLLKNDKYGECHTHRELKESLYMEIINFFDKGKFCFYAKPLVYMCAKLTFSD